MGAQQWTGTALLEYTGDIPRTIVGRTQKVYECTPGNTVTVTGADIEALLSLGWFKEIYSDTPVIVPQTEATPTSAKIVRWYKQENTAVKEGDILVDIETEKAILEVESPASGILSDILAKDGDEVTTGDIIATIKDERNVKNDNT